MSRRLAALNFGLRHVARPLLSRTGTPRMAERSLDLAARLLFLRPRGLDRRVRTLRGPSRPLRLTRLTCGPVAEGAAILYLHGGGYVAGSARTHAGLLGRLSQLSGLAVEAPDYRLAQEAPAPAALEDALAAWDALSESGISPDRIVLGGDSAGGGLALALLSRLCDRGTPPAGLFALSPWTDLTASGGSLATNAARDAILPVARMGELTDIVLAGMDASDPRISPLFASFRDPPPVYFQASRTEILLDDALRMAERLREAGGEVQIDLWDDAPHVWHVFDGWLPEAREALVRVAAFARRCLRQPGSPGES